MVPMELDAMKKCNKAPQKETCKYYNCQKIGYLTKVCRSKKQAKATQSNKHQDTTTTPFQKEGQSNATKVTAKSDHVTLSWTTCYNNNYYTHLSEKHESRQFSKRPKRKQLHATGQEKSYDIPTTKSFLQQIEMLQGEIDKLCNGY